MPAPIGGDQLVGATTTYSVAPDATYAAGQTYYVDDTLSDYDTTGKDAVSASRYDIEAFYGAYTGWSQADTSTVVISLDLLTAKGGTLFNAQGWYGTTSIYRPTAAHLEWSDDNSAWTTVDNFTGLTGGGQPGAHGWLIQWDISAEGDHRYWRVTLTHGGTWLFLSNLEMQI